MTGKLVGKGISKETGSSRRKGEQDATGLSHHYYSEIAAQQFAHRVTHTLQPLLLPPAAFVT